MARASVRFDASHMRQPVVMHEEGIVFLSEAIFPKRFGSARRGWR
jgi:hypothetical protein